MQIHRLWLLQWPAQATHLIGFPEARLALAEAAIYLARAPKSNRVMEAYEAAAADARATPAEPVPLHLRNAPTPPMKSSATVKDTNMPTNTKRA